MNPEIQALITKGRRSLESARRQLDSGDADFAVSRTYYAMFYLSEALLLTRGLRLSKHSAVIAALGKEKEFVKSGLLAARHFQAIRDASEARNVGDYDYTLEFPAERARKVLDEAMEFVSAAEAILHGP